MPDFANLRKALLCQGEPDRVPPLEYHVDDAIQARFLGSRDNVILKGPLDLIFLDKGRQEGVALGDIFELYASPSDRGGVESDVEEIMATVRVVHMGDRSATARVMGVNAPDISKGTAARQTAKLPS